MVAALGSWLDARAAGGLWLLRVDDIDPPRQTVTAEQLLDTLTAHDLTPDGPTLHQSDRLEHYRARLSDIPHFACNCSRKTVAQRGFHGPNCHSEGRPASLRAHLFQAPGFHDRRCGEQPETALDAPIIWRKDDLPSYFWACALDDAENDVTHVVRGEDLLTQTAPQLAIMQALGLKPPSYLHLPLVTHANGQKLSKQNLAQPLNLKTPNENLAAAAQWLFDQPMRPFSFDLALQTWIQTYR